MVVAFGLLVGFSVGARPVSAAFETEVGVLAEAFTSTVFCSDPFEYDEG